MAGAPRRRTRLRTLIADVDFAAAVESDSRRLTDIRRQPSELGATLTGVAVGAGVGEGVAVAPLVSQSGTALPSVKRSRTALPSGMAIGVGDGRLNTSTDAPWRFVT